MKNSPFLVTLLGFLTVFAFQSAQADTKGPKGIPHSEKYQTYSKKVFPKVKILSTGKVHPDDYRKSKVIYDPYSQMIRLSDVQKRALSERKSFRKVPILWHTYAY